MEATNTTAEIYHTRFLFNRPIFPELLKIRLLQVRLLHVRPVLKSKLLGPVSRSFSELVSQLTDGQVVNLHNWLVSGNSVARHLS